ncbi:MAG: DNA-directed RNA polymerase subunit N [Candidatus Methanomethylicota archaeon]|uniref:DNA-directed RNA polymerase subunit Rpo10 n=1 Tax=Thermoproteota archaeon TaxID=2056631 RepID=A0A497ET74_9CREN|nr:MAG: DNA-directed RNA polymerase subunit N [Candidatus Verstraetearchaeota archaeon]RLE52477.1 MAG: DNA-directed RNA polymerase subunit N [Candidatus Verstraetearchaeota archaeon]
MIIPVRCFTCGSLLGDKWEEFKRRVTSGEDPAKVLDDMGIVRYCCRRTILSHVDLLQDMLKFSITYKRG